MLSKSYIFPFVVFLISLGLGAVLFALLSPFAIKEFPGLIMRTVLSIVFIILTIKYVNDTDGLFCVHKITLQQITLSVALLLLFAVNNYFHSVYSVHTEYMKNSSIGLVFTGFIVNSFYEEFVYRGFIQGYVNQNLKEKRSPISQGNIFASVLMFITHFGFFAVMDVFFAITGLILVFIFSLVMGYMRDKGSSIWLLIIIHTAVNFVHVILNWEHYY